MCGGAGKGVGCGELRGACHVIPYLDNFVQLFVEDLDMLNLPTLLREADPLMGVVAEALDGAQVKVESDPRMALVRPYAPPPLRSWPRLHATGHWRNIADANSRVPKFLMMLMMLRYRILPFCLRMLA
jgi:hypothetical protein